MKFLDKVANYIKEEEISLENLTIVLPSERARKYLSSSLFNAFQKPIIAPDIITMDRWVKSYSDKIIIDSTRALIELYKIQL